jgi:hypothetical protein
MKTLAKITAGITAAAILLWILFIVATNLATTSNTYKLTGKFGDNLTEEVLFAKVTKYAPWAWWTESEGDCWLVGKNKETYTNMVKFNEDSVHIGKYGEPIIQIFKIDKSVSIVSPHDKEPTFKGRVEEVEPLK